MIAARWLTTLGLGSLLASASTRAEAADEPSRVLVLPVRVSAELPPDTAAEIRTLVADNLADDGLQVIAEGESTCEDAVCRRDAAAGVGASYVIETAVVGDEDEFTVTVTVLSGETGEPLRPFEHACQICGFVEVRDMVRLRAIDARAELLRLHAADMAVATASSEPTPTPVATPPAPRSKLVPAGWALAGAGGAATLGGVVLLAMHHQSSGCLDNPRGGDCVPVRFTTAPAGAALLGVGVVAVVSGAVMIVVGRRAERRSEASRVSVAPGGLRLRF